jgi:hypothetical protein
MHQPSNLSKTAALQKTVQTICKQIGPVAIYSFGLRTQRQTNHNALFPEAASKTKTFHFDLVVFADDIPANAIADISNIIHDESSGKVSVTLLVHSVTSFRKASGNQMHFFWKVICLGNLLYYNEKRSLGKEIPLLLSQNFGHSTGYWQDRVAIARSLLGSEALAEREGVTAVCQSMLHMAVGQVCLGLIEVFLGYRPNHFALGYLFGICSTFSSLASDIFPRDTDENKRLFIILATNISTLRQSHSDHYGKSDIDMLAGRCWRFLGEAGEIVNERLEKDLVSSGPEIIPA